MGLSLLTLSPCVMLTILLKASCEFISLCIQISSSDTKIEGIRDGLLTQYIGLKEDQIFGSWRSSIGITWGYFIISSVTHFLCKIFLTKLEKMETILGCNFIGVLLTFTTIGYRLSSCLMISGLTTSIQLSVARNVMNGCILRCISLNVDLNNERRRFCFLECMNYLFYFPLLLSGPFVSFCTFTSQMYENRNRNTHTCIELATCVLVSLVLLLIPYCAYADIYTYAPTNLYFLTIWQLGQTFILLQAIILHLPTIRASGDGLILYPVTCKIPYLSLAPSHASKIVDPGFHLFLRKTTGCDLLDSFWYPVLRGVLPSKTGIDFVGKEILSISCASKSTRKPFDVLPEGLAVVTETEPVWELEASITLTQISDIFSHKNKDIETLLLNYLPWSWIQDLIPTARSPSDITVGIYSSERAKVKIETNVPLLREVDLALSSIQECYAKNPTVYNNIADMIGTDGIRSSDMHQLRFTKID